MDARDTLAPLDRRFGALLVDWLLCIFASRIFADPFAHAWLPLIVLVVEYTFFLGFFAQTPGMWFTKIMCVRYGLGGPLGVPRAFLRAVLLALVIPAVIMDPERRGLHDRAADSIVLRVPPAPSS